VAGNQTDRRSHVGPYTAATMRTQASGRAHHGNGVVPNGSGQYGAKQRQPVAMGAAAEL